MTTFSIFERYEAAVKLWEFISPNIPAPPKETLVYWLSKYTNEQFEKAVLRIPGKFRNREYIAPEDAYRMMTAELRDMNMRKQRTQTISQSFDGRTRRGYDE
jgi:hypothetical protein